MQAAFLQPVALVEDSLGIDAITEVGPGGHFFMTDAPRDSIIESQASLKKTLTGMANKQPED